MIINSLIYGAATFIKTLIYAGELTRLTTGRFQPGLAAAGDYIIVGTGRNDSVSSKMQMDYYDTRFTHGNIPMTVTGLRAGVGQIGKTAVFAGGGTGSSGGYYGNNDVYYIDDSLTATKLAAVLTNGGHSGASVSFNDVFFIYGGGQTDWNTGGLTNKADAFNASGTKTALSNLTNIATANRGAYTGNYALIAGGCYAANNTSTLTSYATVDTYNLSLTKGTATNLSQARYAIGTATFNNRALFIGGETSSTPIANYVAHNIIDAYDNSLTRTNPATLTTAVFNPAVIAFDDYLIVYGGGTTGSGAATNAFSVYDKSFTKISLSSYPTAVSGANWGAVTKTTGIIASLDAGSSQATNYKVIGFRLI